jgi:hypothetical protein
MSTRKYPLSIRFEGPGLKTDGLPIGELGEAMIAVQRLVYKAYLIQNKRDFVHTSITEIERQKYALQIADRKHGSEHVMFTWLAETLQNPIIQQQIASMLVLLGGAALKYVERVVKITLDDMTVGPDQPNNEDADELALRMYPEIQEIVKHIGNPMIDGEPQPKGKRRIPRINSVRITIAGVKRPIVFDQKVKEHVKKIENSTRYGPLKTIVGKVDKAHVLKGDCIEALIGEEQFWVKLCMKKEGDEKPKKKQSGKNSKKTGQVVEKKEKKMFRQVLGHLANRKTSNEFYFTGRPIYRLGRSLSWFNEFEVEKIDPVQPPPKSPRKKRAPQGG